MSFNKILAKKVTGTIVKDGVTVILSVATKTNCWDRPNVAVDVVGDALAKSIGVWKEPLPSGTVEVCARESVYPNPDGDNKDHLTVVCFNKEGEGKSKHVPAANLTGTM